jgi:uncharacterized membrane protein
MQLASFSFYSAYLDSLAAMPTFFLVPLLSWQGIFTGLFEKVEESKGYKAKACSSARDDVELLFGGHFFTRGGAIIYNTRSFNSGARKHHSSK